MVRIEPADLPRHAKQGLQRYQAEVDAERNYAQRVEIAAAKFASYNRNTNAVFEQVKSTLDAMCAGARRCMYCEDSAADEVEHHHPKNLYPELAFDWENYLYACGPCNGPKNNRFAVFTDRGEVLAIERKRGDRVTKPATGKKVLLHPRAENPLDYVMLDIGGGTFCFVPLADEGSPEFKRAEYTIDVLGLNRRAFLPRARKEAYESYRARIVEFGRRRESGTGAKELNLLAHAVRRMQHPTVFQEMRRQRELLVELKKLFREVPEALHW
jgi:uncharacterized protein (TIGR02646 family)